MDYESGDDQDGLVRLPDSEIRNRLALVRQQHLDLSAAVEALETMPTPNQLQIMRLKKQKLGLRDQIARLESALTPDIIA